MFLNIREYLRPEKLEEAYELIKDGGALIIGGGAFLNLADREVNTAVDLSRLGLDYIREKGDQLEIGAMTTLREIELSSEIRNIYNGLISKTVSEIMGIQLRNAATLGGTVFGKYGFSDLLTSLLGVGARVELYKGGVMELEKFLENKHESDILLKVIIKKSNSRAVFRSLRNTAADFSILNVSAVKEDGAIRICVGARPGIAKLAAEAMEFINGVEPSEENSAKAGEIASEKLDFGSDLRGSAEYRRELCKALVKRCIMEVL